MWFVYLSCTCEQENKNSIASLDIQIQFTHGGLSLISTAPFELFMFWLVTAMKDENVPLAKHIIMVTLPVSISKGKIDRE